MREQEHVAAQVTPSVWGVCLVCFNLFFFFFSSHRSDDGSSQGIQEGTTSLQTASPQEVSDEQEIDEQTNNVENIGPAIQSAEHTVPGVTASPAGNLVTFPFILFFFLVL